MKALDPTKINKFCTMLEKASNIVLTCHYNPDGDAIGCVVGLKNFIQAYYRATVNIVAPGQEPAFLSFVSDGEDITRAEKEPQKAAALIAGCDLLICMDFNTLSRTGCLEESIKGATCPKILIDHHPYPEMEPFELVLSETEVSSASEMLYSILMACPQTGGDSCKLPFRCAQAILTGITTDTNNFANSTYPSTLKAVSALMDAGVDRDKVVNKLYFEYRINRVNAMGYCLDRLLRTKENGLAYIIITKKDQEILGLEDGETESFVNIPLSAKSIRLSLLLKEDESFYRVSIRSKKGVKANALAAEFFCGGGHELASGGRYYFADHGSDPEELAQYIERVSARFLQEEAPVK